MTPRIRVSYRVIDERKICSSPICLLANIPQPLDRFLKSPQNSDGLLAWCKPCANRAHRIAAKKRKEKDPVAFKEWQRLKNLKQVKSQKEWRENNKEHLDAVRKRWRSDNPKKLRAARERARFKRLGTSLEWFETTLAKQRSCCAICGRSNPGGSGNTFHIDHDHKCCDGRIACGSCNRGLLCASCNIRLGVVETEGWLDNALAYLSLFPKK